MFCVLIKLSHQSTILYHVSHKKSLKSLKSSSTSLSFPSMAIYPSNFAKSTYHFKNAAIP